MLPSSRGAEKNWMPPATATLRVTYAVHSLKYQPICQGLSYFCSSLFMIASHYNYYESWPSKWQSGKRREEGGRETEESINRNLNPLLSADIGDRLAQGGRAVISTRVAATSPCEECCGSSVFITHQGNSHHFGRGSDERQLFGITNQREWTGV